MFCSKCGSQLPEGANVCPNCGEKVEKDINFSDVTNYAGQKVQEQYNNVQSQIQDFRNKRNEERNGTIHDVHEIFVNEDEQQKAVIGGGYLSNLLKTGVLGNGFGILTDRRLYYRGKCFHKVGNHYLKTDEDCTVDLQDITSTGFTYTKRLWLLLTAVGFFLGALGIFVASEGENILAPLMIFLLGVGVLIGYLYLKITTYIVTFAGGSLSLRASDYDIEKVREFDKTLHQVKDEYLASRR